MISIHRLFELQLVPKGPTFNDALKTAIPLSAGLTGLYMYQNRDKLFPKKKKEKK